MNYDNNQNGPVKPSHNVKKQQKHNLSTQKRNKLFVSLNQQIRKEVQNLKMFLYSFEKDKFVYSPLFNFIIYIV